jgi:asparagine N-glycosylation enzyme membrane subunit Stt3
MQPGADVANWPPVLAILQIDRKTDLMADTSPLTALRNDPFPATLAAALALLLVRAVLDGWGMHENFATMDNDDILRLVMVRDWIGGQGWFDMTQYRLLPPEGVVMHWSRYIDVGIAAIIVPLSWLVPMDTAEQLAVTIWPTLVFILTVLIIGFGTRRIFGTWAACFALAIAVIWPTTGHHSGAGNIDHHNVQMLMMTIVAFALIWPVRPVAAGVIGGIAAAFSLAVGLEALPYIVVAGAVALVRHLLDVTSESRAFLVAFCLALGAAAAVFWLGQTAPAMRGTAMCDRLSMPALSLIGVAVAASLLAATLSRFGAWSGLAAAVLVAILGVVLIWPVVGPCLAGPYGDLPEELQLFISTRISEALPAHRFIRNNPAGFVVFTLPIIVALGAGGLMILRGATPRAPLTVLWVLCLLGLVMVLYQIRTVIMAAAVIPMLGGVVIARALGVYLQTRAPGAAVVWLVLATTIISPTLIAYQVDAFAAEDDETPAHLSPECRSFEALNALNILPPGRFITPMNLGPAVLWATHHDTLSAGYHVNDTIITNSLMPFQLPEDETAAFLQRSGATYLLMCSGAEYESDFVTAVAAGAGADWLRVVPLPEGDLLVFEILPK